MRWMVQLLSARITLFERSVRSRSLMNILFALILVFVCLGFSALSERFAACVFAAIAPGGHLDRGRCTGSGFCLVSLSTFQRLAFSFS